MINDFIVIDATGAAIGRIATYAAKQALYGKKVFVINCSDAVITGKQHAILDVYKAKISRGGYAQKGPYIPRTIEKLMKRTIRGMLPWNITRGREALKRIKCFSWAPEEYSKHEKIITFKKAKQPYITLSKLIDLI